MDEWDVDEEKMWLFTCTVTPPVRFWGQCSRP